MNKLYIRKSALVSFILVLLVSPAVSAIDEGFYSSNDILFYNPDEKCVTSASSSTLSGGENAEKTFNYFVEKGLTDKQSAGIVGNLMVESGINPNSNQTGGGPGRGIAQWSVDGRWKTLQQWADGREILELQTQLDFVWYELNGSYKAALAELNTTTTISEATKVFSDKYEAPGIPHMDRRIALANEAYGKYTTGSSTISASTGTTPDESVATITSSTGCASSEGSGDIVSIAQAELKKGIKEQPIGCDAGNASKKGDCGTEVNKYTDSTLEYWCADFVSWVYKQAGKPFTGGSSGGWRIAGVSGVASWFKKNGTFTENGGSANPKPGDTYMINGYNHIGIVERVEGDTLYTISGNTSTDNTGNGNGVGAGVYKNFRSNSSIDGFGSLSK